MTSNAIFVKEKNKVKGNFVVVTFYKMHSCFLFRLTLSKQAPRQVRWTCALSLSSELPLAGEPNRVRSLHRSEAIPIRLQILSVSRARRKATEHRLCFLVFPPSLRYDDEYQTRASDVRRCV